MDTMSADATAPDGGYGHSQPTRFKKMSSLLARFEGVKKNRKSDQFKRILQQYNRHPYKTEEGLLPNFGSLRGKIGQALTAYVDFSCERSRWFEVKTDHGDGESNSILWGDAISHAFQKYCIGRWDERASDIMLEARDMLLFGKGMAFWPSKDGCVYPENVGMESVWPDGGAKLFPDTWDIVFVQRTMTAVDLFRKVEDGAACAANGWRRESVLRLIGPVSGQAKGESDQDIYLRFKNCDIGPAGQDYEFSIVFAYVREFRSGGSSVSRYVFPSRGHIPSRSKARGAADGDADALGYLVYQPNYADCISQAVAVAAHDITRNFYEDPSFAELIYASSRTYDMVMNRILQGVEDNMRLYLRTENNQQYQKLKRLRHRQQQVLEPGVKIEQDRIERRVGDALQVVRVMMNDTNGFTGQYTPGASDGKNQPLTARQAELDVGEAVKISSAQMKLFNLCQTRKGSEIYRRWVSQEEPLPGAPQKIARQWKNFKKFKGFLARRGVPDEAWSFDAVQISSVLSLGAGSPAAKLQASRVTLEALSASLSSQGERLAARQMIASVQGVENVDAFIPMSDDLPVVEDSLIGLENDALSRPDAIPGNTPVLGRQLHIRHIRSHVADAQITLQRAAALFEGIPRMGKANEAVMLKTVQDMLVGIDNKLAHSQAHIQMASRSRSRQVAAQLSEFARQIQEINRQQDKFEQVVGEMLLKSSGDGQQSQEPPEMTHKRAMYSLEEEHTARMLDFDFQKSTMKAEQLREQSAANTIHKQGLETIKTIRGEQREIIRLRGRQQRDETPGRGNAKAKKSAN